MRYACPALLGSLVIGGTHANAVLCRCLCLDGWRPLQHTHRLATLLRCGHRVVHSLRAAEESRQQHWQQLTALPCGCNLTCAPAGPTAGLPPVS